MFYLGPIRENVSKNFFGGHWSAHLTDNENPNIMSAATRSVATNLENGSLKPVFIIVTSIGNPEAQFSRTRHNAGHIINNYLTHSPFIQHPKLKGIQYSLDQSRPNLLFLKTDCYMNVSGKPIVSAWKMFSSMMASQYDVKYLVLHDELSKEVGKIQLRYGNVSVRGHNGLKSIVENCGTGFYRIGVGISRPESRDPRDVAKWVLRKFPEQDAQKLEWEVTPLVNKTLEKILERTEKI